MFRRNLIIAALVAAIISLLGACQAAATPVPTTAPTAVPTTAPEHGHPMDGLSYDAVVGSREIDGVVDDWEGVPSLEVDLHSLDAARSMESAVQVSFDASNIYFLFSVPDDYNATLGEHELSGSVAVSWAIDHDAGPHMGSDGVNIAKGLGMVDLWHWEIDCGPGEMSGGIDRTEDGDDPACNLDDEYANSPLDRHDDTGNNLLKGVYDHSGRATGEDAQGIWYWELSRPLVTDDAQDIQFKAGDTVKLAVAYWDPDESPSGWSGPGHLQSAEGGWITVKVPDNLP